MRELTLPARLVLLPGLGTAPQVFEPQRRAFGDKLIAPAFIPAQGNESIERYAKRWAKKLNPMLAEAGEPLPLFLGGQSLGGMIALELAMHLEPRPRAVLLIASSRRADALTLPVQFAQRLSTFLPGAPMGLARKLLALGWALREGLDDEGKDMYVDSITKSDDAFLKWGAREAMDWPGFDPPDNYPPIYQVHGSDDWIITPPPANQATLIEGGRHLINFTHTHSVNRFLFDHILKHTPEAHLATPAIEDPHTTAQRRLQLEGAPVGTPLA
ncbi:MAG: alpha/beta hydrolase [Planctomycetota bacterium]